MSATENILTKMSVVLDELDRQGHIVAAAYVAQAVAIIELKMATDGTNSV